MPHAGFTLSRFGYFNIPATALVGIPTLQRNKATTGMAEIFD
jgi:hypothetical protein